MTMGTGTTATGSCRQTIEKLGSILNSAGMRRNGSQGVEGVNGWKMTKRKHQGSGEFWLNRPDRILTEDRPGGPNIS
jgi:hypothetical protein